MLRNEKGGIISKVFIIPVGVVVIITVFLTGYFIGKRQGARTASSEKPPALPEVLSQYLPDKDEFTFYKTLTEKGDKTVSIDLKPGGKTKRESEASKTAEAKASDERAGKGAQRTRSTAKEPERTAKKEPASASAESSKVRYTIQVGSYEDRAMAEDDVRGMKQKGYAAFIVASVIPNKGTWYRVRIGSFANRQSAEKLAHELKIKTGVSSFITTE